MSVDLETLNGPSGGDLPPNQTVHLSRMEWILLYGIKLLLFLILFNHMSDLNKRVGHMEGYLRAIEKRLVAIAPQTEAKSVISQEGRTDEPNKQQASR